MGLSKATVAAALAILAESLQREITDATVHAYTLGLGDTTTTQLQAATQRALQTCDRFPSVAELRQLVTTGGMDYADRALLAFDAVERAVSHVGAYKTVDFDDVAINAAIRSLGGWERICDIPCAEFDTHFRREFMKTYQTYARNGVGAEAGAPLCGISERQNAITGLPDKSYKRIETGLPKTPALAQVKQQGIGAKPSAAPRIEFKKP